MKTKLDPQEKARRQGWRTARYEARVMEEAAKKLQGKLPLPEPTRKSRTALAVLSAASIIAAIEGHRAYDPL